MIMLKGNSLRITIDYLYSNLAFFGVVYATQKKESCLNGISEQNSCTEPERNQANTRHCQSTVPENIQRQTILDNNRRLTEWPILLVNFYSRLSANEQVS